MWQYRGRVTCRPSWVVTTTVVFSSTGSRQRSQKAGIVMPFSSATVGLRFSAGKLAVVTRWRRGSFGHPRRQTLAGIAPQPLRRLSCLGSVGLCANYYRTPVTLT
jgi:hypothetical protein